MGIRSPGSTSGEEPVFLTKDGLPFGHYGSGVLTKENPIRLGGGASVRVLAWNRSTSRAGRGGTCASHSPRITGLRRF
jgi:hypothetical protein